MTRHHFADYMKDNPKAYQAFSDNLWNSFVTVTHAIGLNRFFTFTPDFSAGSKSSLATGRFSDEEIPGDKAKTYTQLPLW